MSSHVMLSHEASSETQVVLSALTVRAPQTYDLSV